jgi:hypothetical protein
MTAHDIGPGRPSRGEPGCPPRGVACAGHVFGAHVRADPGLVWTALTDPGQTAAYLYGLAAHSSWVPGDPIQFRLGGRAAAIGQVLHARRQERLSCLLQAGPGDPPAHLTWLLRPAPAGCTVRLEIDQVDHADSPVLAGLQLSVNPA